MSRFPLLENLGPRTRAVVAAGVCAVAVLAAAGCSSASSSGASDAAGHASPASSSPSPRGSAAAGSIRVTGAYVPQPATPDVAAVYFTIADIGDQADTLISATSTPAALASLMSESTAGGAESMTPLTDGLAIPAHGQVTLAPDGYHLMLTNPAIALKQGETVTLSLRFERAGTVTLKVPVTSLLSDAMTGQTATAGASSMAGMPGM